MAFRIRISYQLKLFILTVTCALVMIVSFVAFQTYREQHYKAEQLSSLLEQCNQQCIDALHSGSSPEQFFSIFSKYFSGLRIVVHNSDGHLLFDSSAATTATLSQQHRPSAAEMLEEAAISDRSYSLSQRQAPNEKRYIYSTMQTDRYSVTSALPYSLTLTDILQADSALFWILLALMAILTIVIYFATRTLGENIRRLRAFAETIDRGETVAHTPKFPNDELGEISQHIVGVYSKLQQATVNTEREHAVALHEQEDKIRLKRQLTNNINHELKTPVAAIEGYLETIIESPDMDEQTRQGFMQRCYEQAMRLKNLLRDVSTITRIEEASSVIEKEPCDMRRIIDDVATDIAAQPVEKRMRVHLSLPETMPLEGNASLLGSVFRNLTDNAIAYSGGRDIYISLLEDTSERYTVSFADNGIGVDQAHLERIFERFYRIDKGRSRKAGGTGLGLSIVRNAIRFHGGDITAANSENGGLEMRFTINKK